MSTEERVKELLKAEEVIVTPQRNYSGVYRIETRKERLFYKRRDEINASKKILPIKRVSKEEAETEIEFYHAVKAAGFYHPDTIFELDRTETNS